MRRALILACLLATGCLSRNETHPYYALDGDTIATGAGPHIRLLYIDAPELPGHCRLGRHCQPGDPYAAKNYLQQLLVQGDMVCRDHGLDVYHRRLADCDIYFVLPNGQKRRFNLSETMLASGLVGLYHRS
jgi:endonuclease YncB( thermonuclease family)